MLLSGILSIAVVLFWATKTECGINMGLREAFVQFKLLLGDPITLEFYVLDFLS